MDRRDEKLRLIFQRMFRDITPSICADVIVYWHAYYQNERTGQCSLCGGFGVIDTRGRALNFEGRDLGRLHWCICPYGQSYREGTEEAGITDSTGLMEDLYRCQHEPDYHADFFGKVQEIVLKQKKEQENRGRSPESSDQ